MLNSIFDKIPTFEIFYKDKKTKARTGLIKTPHGNIETPYFFPVGTKASVKSLDPFDLLEIGAQAILANTYHLFLQPGEDLIQKMGGLSEFMNWHGPTMTDSGGFQVFSLGISMEHGLVKFFHEELDNLKPRQRLNKITEEGAFFQSHIDGSKKFLSPEISIEIQEKLGADLIVGFDDLESPKYSYEETRKSLNLTKKWLLRSIQAKKSKNQLLYGVTHGGKFQDLRIESAKFNDKNFSAIALGGAHEDKKNMHEVISWTIENTDEAKPKHLLGIGEIDDIFNGVERGIDTFDCVIPTRMGRMGNIFVHSPIGNFKNKFRIDITKKIYEKESYPLDKKCDCKVCLNYSTAYIHHLFRAHELLGYKLASYHNLYFLIKLMEEIRTVINADRFLEYKKKWLR